MTTWATPGGVFPAASEDAGTGLVGTIGVRISNPATQTDVVARTTAGIVEYPVGSGIYSTQLTAPTTPGTYQIIWDTGSDFAFDELLVSASNPANIPNAQDLCTIADVKLLAGIPADDTDSDDLAQACVTAASARIAHRYQREFAPVAGTPTRRFEFTSRRVNLAPRDLQSASAVVLDPDGAAVTLAATDYRLRPAQSISGTYYVLQLRSGLMIPSSEFGAELDITGVWGFPSIPDDVVRAAALTAATWLDRAADQYGIDSDGAPGGIPPNFASTWSIPSAAHDALKPFARMVA